MATTAETKAKAIRIYAESGCCRSIACRVAGVPAGMWAHWIETDIEFRTAVQKAREGQHGHRTD